MVGQIILDQNMLQGGNSDFRTGAATIAVMLLSAEISKNQDAS
jgi:hypothetical protein